MRFIKLEKLLRKKRFKLSVLLVILLSITTYELFRKTPVFSGAEVGQAIDSLNHVKVYYNGFTGSVDGRNRATDGYNLGLKYQCVEFVKRYYYKHLKHKMPDTYGNAIDFYNVKLLDGGLNKQRALIQFSNPSESKPQVNDLVVYNSSFWNEFGHVAIISAVTDTQIEIIQQNPGPLSLSREVYPLNHEKSHWVIDNERILGWLRKP